MTPSTHRPVGLFSHAVRTQAAAASVMPRRPVRVAFINDTVRNGGPGRSLYYVLKFLDPRAVHRTVILPRKGIISELMRRGGVAEDIVFERDFVENPFEPWRRPMERPDFRAPLVMRGARVVGNVVRGAVALARLTAFVRRGRFDLLYCNGTTADFGGGALAWSTGVPALWHVRYSSVPTAMSALHQRLAAGPGVKRIFCVSAASASLFAHCPGKVRIVHNAVDVDELAPARVKPTLRKELGLGRDVVIFGSVGRILRRKGYVEMVSAAKMALDRMSADEHGSTRFVVIGDTPSDFRADHLAECRSLAVQLGVADRFHFLGFREDVKPLIADFDVAVVPSVYADPLPRAVIESMALGKPVVAFGVGGVAEMLADGDAGALCCGQPPDVEGMAAQFLRYMRDPGLRARQGRAARARIERDFNGAIQGLVIQNEIVRLAGLA